MMRFKYHHTDRGLCRVCFTVQGAKNPKNTYYYCIQEDLDCPKMFRCSCTSPDAPWEPEYSVNIMGELIIELPTNIDCYAKELVNQWKDLTQKE